MLCLYVLCAFHLQRKDYVEDFVYFTVLAVCSRFHRKVLESKKYLTQISCPIKIDIEIMEVVVKIDCWEFELKLECPSIYFRKHC
jgi:hypothetical protein